MIYKVEGSKSVSEEVLMFMLCNCSSSCHPIIDYRHYLHLATGPCVRGENQNGPPAARPLKKWLSGRLRDHRFCISRGDLSRTLRRRHAFAPPPSRGSLPPLDRQTPAPQFTPSIACNAWGQTGPATPERSQHSNECITNSKTLVIIVQLGGRGAPKQSDP